MKSKFMKALMILLIGYIGISLAQDADWKNAQGYISVKQNGIIKNYIIVSDGNTIKLVPISEDPSKILKNKQSIMDEINKKGG